MIENILYGALKLKTSLTFEGYILHINQFVIAIVVSVLSIFIERTKDLRLYRLIGVCYDIRLRKNAHSCLL